MPVPHAQRKEYMAAYIRDHYQKNKQYYVERAAARRASLVAFIRAAKDAPCADCGAHLPYYMMDFDHVRGEKACDIAKAAASGWGKERIQAEIDKCEVVCSNCHRARTHSRLSM